MGRKKKQTDIEDAIKEADQAPRKNSDLTEDERRALHFRHCAEYERALAVKKLADAGLKNVGKRIKAEGDSVAKCKKTIQAGRHKAKPSSAPRSSRPRRCCAGPACRLARPPRCSPIDVRPTKLRSSTARSPASRARRAKSPHDPGTPAHDKWMEGWHVGQAA
jgi:hypothetical protein